MSYRFFVSLSQVPGSAEPQISYQKQDCLRSQITGPEKAARTELKSTGRNCDLQ